MRLTIPSASLVARNAALAAWYLKRKTEHPADKMLALCYTALYGKRVARKSHRAGTNLATCAGARR